MVGQLRIRIYFAVIVTLGASLATSLAHAVEAANPPSKATQNSENLLDAFTPLGRPTSGDSQLRQQPKNTQTTIRQNAEPIQNPRQTPTQEPALERGTPTKSSRQIIKKSGGGIAIESNQKIAPSNAPSKNGPSNDDVLDDDSLEEPIRTKRPPTARRVRDEEPEGGSLDQDEAQEMQKSTSSKRAVKVSWEPIRSTRTYLLEIADSDSMEKILIKKSVSKTEAWVSLKPGTYYYRVDGRTASGRLIEGDEVFELVVNPQAPDLLEPSDLTTFSKRLTTRGVDFSWQSGFGGSSYIFEVISESGKIYRKKLNENTFSWLPPREGIFYWRVGFITPTGRDWSKYRSFKVLPLSIKKPLKPDPTGIRVSEYSAIVRLGVAVANYTNSSSDSGTRANGSSLVNLGSAEIRWRGGKTRKQTWTYSGSLNFEMIQSKVLGATFNLPRYYARLFYGKETAEWRFGPLIEVGRKSGAIFLVENETQAKKAEVTRTAYGPGVFGVYRPYETNLGVSGILMVKRETGGTVPKTFFEGLENSTITAKDTPLNNTIAIEAGMGLVYILSPKSLIEGRLRYIKENYSWKGSLGGNSYSNQTLIIFDFGYGYRF